MNLLPAPTPKTQPIVFLDEFGYYLGNNDDPLREEIRQIEGVPNATYLVGDNKVFVFAKLLRLVKEKFGLLQLTGEERKQGILALVPEAWTTPLSAVADWDVVPVPYEVRAEKDGFTIFHRPFNAVIPTRFMSRDALNDALSLLLIGGVVKGGDADFTHHHQPFKLLAPFSISELPPRPDIGVDVAHLQVTQPLDADSGFIDGFAPLPHDLYNQIVSLRMSWQAASRVASDRVYSALPVLNIHRFTLEVLNGAQRDMSDVAEVVGELRGHYPELGMLTETELYDRFDSYQSECCFINGWDASRDDEFLLYLIGLAASKDDLDGDAAREVGRIAAFLALNGMEAQEAFNTAMKWRAYDHALSSLYWRSNSVMNHLRAEREAADLRGGKVTTFLDLFRMGRSFNARPIEATQTIGDFADRKD